MKVNKLVLYIILGIALLCAAYQVYVRISLEEDRQPVRLVVDLNGLKKIAAYENKPIGSVLDQLKKIGITELGVLAETLPDANALGEVYSAKGSGITRLKGFMPRFDSLVQKGLIKSDRTYIYIPEEAPRVRISEQLMWMFGKNELNFIGRDIIEINEPEEEVRGISLGISESQKNYLSSKGFTIIPRVWNEALCNAINMEPNVSLFKGYDVLIFDGEEILGYPEAIPQLASALKKYHIKYGNVEIVKQDGDLQLKKLMAPDIIRVQSVPKDELVKISKDEAVDRYLRAVRERKINLIYLRPFLPPKMEAFPIEYNMGYFKEVKEKIEYNGYKLGKNIISNGYAIDKWVVFVIGAGIAAGVVLLLLSFVELPLGFSLAAWLALLAILGGIEFLIGTLPAQKLFALLAAISFPSWAIISSFSKERENPSANIWQIISAFGKVMLKTSIGIILMVGLLVDFHFLSGAEVFPAVKLALTLPILIVVFYFIYHSASGNIFEWVREMMNNKITIGAVVAAGICLAALGILVARSGNFVLPVPGFEKSFRNMLEVAMFIRPRTKEFLIGYPFLLLAAVYYLSGKKNWLWILAAIGAIAPTSVFNSFSHIHTPLMISFIRSINGLILGIIIGAIVIWFTSRVVRIKDI